MPQLPRHTLLNGVALAGGTSQLATLRQPDAQAAAQNGTQAAAVDRAAPMRWLESGAPEAPIGTTSGVPWPRGTVARGQELSLSTAAQTVLSVRQGRRPGRAQPAEANFVCTNASVPSTALATIQCRQLPGYRLST